MNYCSHCGNSLTAGSQVCSKCGSPRRALEQAFARAEESYVRLRHQFDSGSISSDQFKAAVEAQLIDHGGRYWMIGINSGSWYAYDGKEWRETDAPLATDKRNASGQPKTQDKVVASPAPQKAGVIPDWLLMSIVFGIAILCWLYIAYTN